MGHFSLQKGNAVLARVEVRANVKAKDWGLGQRRYFLLVEDPKTKAVTRVALNAVKKPAPSPAPTAAPTAAPAPDAALPAQ